MILHKLFKHKPTLKDLWKSRIEAFFVGAAIILFWRGIWALADNFLFPDFPVISAFTSLFLGIGILILTRRFVNEFIDDAVEEADEYE